MTAKKSPEARTKEADSLIESSVVPVVERVEAELDRLRQRRPWLVPRIARAGHILITHLSCPHQRVIRVRVSATGKMRFLVEGSNGAVYTVDPASWSCSCPDYHRRDAACKHSISCWVLSKATRATTRPKTRQCDGCGTRFPSADLYDVPEDNMTFFPGERLCRACGIAHWVL